MADAVRNIGTGKENGVYFSWDLYKEVSREVEPAIKLDREIMRELLDENKELLKKEKELLEKEKELLGKDEELLKKQRTSG